MFCIKCTFTHHIIEECCTHKILCTVILCVCVTINYLWFVNDWAKITMNLSTSIMQKIFLNIFTIESETKVASIIYANHIPGSIFIQQKSTL